MVDPQREERIRARLDAAPHRVPLASLVAANRGSLAQRLRAFATTCFAIERAHAMGIVHRDLGPASILVGETWDATIVGWTSAFVPGEPSELVAVRTVCSAPELTAATHDPRADVYSLGMVLSELLAREPLAPELAELCQVATAPDPAQRAITAGGLGERVIEFIEGARNWELRRAIAAQHLSNALVAQDEDREDVVSAEAAAALRLDPGSRPAAELLIRSGSVPKEIAQLIEVETDDGLRDVARIAIWAYVGYIIFAPAFLWFAAGKPGYAVGLLLLVTLNIALLAVHGYTRMRLHEIWFVLANALLIGLIARVASPFLLAPGIAALTATALAMSPTYRSAPTVNVMIGCLSAAVIVPWVAELAHWLSPTTTVVKAGLLLQAPAFHLRDGGQLILMVFYVATLLGSAGWLSFSMMRRERRLRYRTYLQLWQMSENLTNANR